MHDVTNARSVILVFASPQCPACVEYKPRLEAEIERWRSNNAPIVYVDETSPQNQVGVVFIDVTSTHSTVQDLANQHHVAALPTTILLTRYASPVRFEGAIPDTDIYELLTMATR